MKRYRGKAGRERNGIFFFSGGETPLLSFLSLINFYRWEQRTRISHRSHDLPANPADEQNQSSSLFISFN